MNTAQAAPSLRPRRSVVSGVHLAPVAAAFLAVISGTMVATSPRRTLELAGLAGFALATVLLRREWLPGLALGLFALVGAPYLGFPRTFGSYLSPAVVVLLVWAVRTLAAGGERRSSRRAWLAVAVALSIWLAIGATFSLRTGRSFLWTIVFAVTLPLVGAAAGSAGDLGRDALLRAWTLLAIVMGALATGEGLTKWNPLAAHFHVDGQPLVQKWSVYRVETTMGHPLVNAMFFATSAAVMAMLTLSRPTRMRLAATLLSGLGLVFTASRGGVIGLSLGIGLSLVAMVLSRRTTVARRVVASSLVLAALVGVFQAPILKERDRSSEARASSVYRRNVVRTSVSVIRADGYLGSGPGTSQRRVEQAGSPLPVENSLLQLGISTGLPGLGLFGLLLVMTSFAAARQGRWEALAGLVACVVAAAGFNAWDAIPETLALLGLVVVLAFARDEGSNAKAIAHA